MQKLLNFGKVNHSTENFGYKPSRKYSRSPNLENVNFPHFRNYEDCEVQTRIVHVFYSDQDSLTLNFYTCSFFLSLCFRYQEEIVRLQALLANTTNGARKRR